MDVYIVAIEDRHSEQAIFIPEEAYSDPLEAEAVVREMLISDYKANYLPRFGRSGFCLTEEQYVSKGRLDIGDTVFVVSLEVK